jgi:two-component system sensor histidine kinase QseC
MKLISKITFWYIVIIVLIMCLTMFTARNSIAKHIREHETQRLTAQNDSIGALLQAGVRDINTTGTPITITRTTGNIPLTKTQVQETEHYNSHIGRNEHRLNVISWYQAGNDTYKVTSYNYVTRSYLYFSSLVWTLVWKLLLIAVAVVISGALLSRYLLSPFRHTMSAIKQFDITKKDKVRLMQTTTKEFKELNCFVSHMTDKAIEDYTAVKEFSENASHELQTPLAVLQSKLELLAETGIDEPQAKLIEEMQIAIEKLSRINRSLTLLTKLDNLEFKPSQIKFCRLAKEVVGMYNDRIELKQLKINSRMDSGIYLNIHQTLAEILLNNLISNAIRHNIEGGSIDLELTNSHLYISNTGLPPELPTDELFKRFRKSNQSAESTGLGLAIVKQICEVSNFEVSYDYHESWHHVRVQFNKEGDFKNEPRPDHGYTPLILEPA